MNSFFPISLPGVVAGKIRDLNYFCFNDMLLVFACDSDGGVGPLPKDESYRSAEIAGKMYPKCVLMELLACGAEIIAVYNDFCYEESNCNREICDSITDLVVSVGRCNDELWCIVWSCRHGRTWPAACHNAQWNIN